MKTKTYWNHKNGSNKNKTHWTNAFLTLFVEIQTDSNRNSHQNLNDQKKSPQRNY